MPQDQGMSKANVETARKVLAANRAEAQAGSILPHWHPACELISVMAGVEPRTYRGHDGLRRYTADLAEVFEAWINEVEEVLAVDSDTVFATIRSRVVGKGSGATAEARLGVVFVFSEGQIVWCRTYSSRDEALEAVGLRDKVPLSITHITTVVVPVSDQEEALAFYVERLGLAKVLDFTYESGERWLEVAPHGSTISLTLAEARPERPAGIETGIALASRDVRGALEALRAAGVRTDLELLPQGIVTWWAGAPLAGQPDQFRVFDPDGNSLLIVADLDEGATPSS